MCWDTMNINFVDLKAQRESIKDRIDQAIYNVLDHGQYILGPEVEIFERRLAKFSNAKYALGCANGTDALVLALRSLSIKAGDAVFCPSFTYCATAEAIAIVGATPIFVDIDRKTYNIDSQNLSDTISHIITENKYKPKAIIAVDLFGQPANYDLIVKIATQYNLKLISDSAQGFGCKLNDKNPSDWADIVTTSFFPAKPLGCYGDGGAIITNNKNLYNIIKSLRFHGIGDDKFDNVRIGMNSRLDTIQAAILLEKLNIFPEEIEKRNKIANNYSDCLAEFCLATPNLINNAKSTWAQYTIEVENSKKIQSLLVNQNIPTARYYPKPIHMQKAYKEYPVSNAGLTNTDDCRKRVLSLPMHAYLSRDSQNIIIEAVLKAII